MSALLVTVDTEGDDIWRHLFAETTNNSTYIPRFQNLCERFGIRPTYLVNHEMALCPKFRNFGKSILTRDVAEIGMHLHAWSTPPVFGPLDTQKNFAPFLVEYPTDVMHHKIAFMTNLLQDTFGEKMTSHRSGRWVLNEVYAQALVTHGYNADCSVTPNVVWREQRSEHANFVGVDYRNFPRFPYFMDLTDISKKGGSDLLQIPVTIRETMPGFLKRSQEKWPANSIATKLTRRIWPTHWMRPHIGNIRSLIETISIAEHEQWPCVSFMLHSSELMPGGSPYFPNEEAIEQLYRDLQLLFSITSKKFHGQTISEYREAATENRSS